MPTIQMTCPKCGGSEMWDNRTTKKNPAAPDYKCANRACDGVVWPPRGGNGHAAPAAAPAATTKQPFTQGPHIPGMDAPPADTSPAADRLASLFKLHSACVVHATHVANDLEETYRIKVDLCGISALAAQVFIAATRNG